VLDLSWNLIGVKPPPSSLKGEDATHILEGDIGRAWGQLFCSNKTLAHLDLSFNQIGYPETVIIADEIRENQSIIGLHYSGNNAKGDKLMGKVDPIGFINFVPVESAETIHRSQLVAIPDGTPYANATKPTSNL
jgi:hypothetical protein